MSAKTKPPIVQTAPGTMNKIAPAARKIRCQLGIGPFKNP